MDSTDDEDHMLCFLFAARNESLLTFLTRRKDSTRSATSKENTFLSRDEQHVSRFPCSNCSSVFSLKHNLQYHLRVECGRPPRYKCPYCVYRTKHPSNVRAHSMSHKITVSRFNASTISMECIRRGITLATNAATYLHEKTIYTITSSSNAVSCQGSYETMPHRSNGNQISRKKQRGIYSCTNTNCVRSFNWKGNLMRHLRYECGLQPRFKCPYCNYCCKVKGDVGKHIIRRHKDAAVYVLDLGP
ncbi:hypothetical protein HN011_011877 [Eciton burchellii]|nr:hypothetical protein HN011_011877 [Eciton burchellii]